MKKPLITSLLASAGMLLGMASVAHATVFTETVDVGQTLATATDLPGGTTSITGTLSGGNADLFRFGWGGGAFNVNTNTSTGDTQLSLFDAAGLGLIHDDDSGGFAGPAVISTAALAAGIYYLGVSTYNNDPVSAGGAIFPTGNPGPFGPTGPGGGQSLTGWSGGGSSSNYVVNFRVATTSVPEPASLALLGIGLAGLGAMRRRKSA